MTAPTFSKGDRVSFSIRDAMTCLAYKAPAPLIAEGTITNVVTVTSTLEKFTAYAVATEAYGVVYPVVASEITLLESAGETAPASEASESIVSPRAAA